MNSARIGWSEGVACLFSEYSPLHHTKKTVRMTRTILADFEAFARAKLPGTEMFIDSVTREIIEAYQRIRLASGKSRSTVNVDVRHLKAFFRWCEGKGWIEVDPSRKVKLLRVVRREEESDLLILTVEEVRTVYDELIRRNDLLIADLVKLIANQGFRINEALHLRARDVDLEGGWIYIRTWGDWGPKDKDSRKVRMNEASRAVLNRNVISSGGPDGLIFRTRKGTVLGERNMFRRLKHAAVSVRIEKANWKCLRHTWASRRAEQVPEHVLTAEMGHSDPMLVGKYYRHIRQMTNSPPPVVI
jgi:integrase